MTDVKRLPVLVSLQHLSFRFPGGERLLEDLSLSFDHTPTAIVGRNGAGKSVLARLIAGVLPPSSGTIDTYGTLAYVPQTLDASPDASVARITGTAEALAALERMASGELLGDEFDLIADRWDLAQRLRKALDDAGLGGIDLSQRADTLSGGQLARIAVIGAMLAAPSLLILDEPTNHLDSDGRSWLLRELGQWQGGLIVVSHDRELLDRMERIVELSPLGVKVYGGNYEAYRTRRDTEHQAAQAALEHARLARSRERKRLQQANDDFQRHAARSRKHAETANVDRFTRSRWKGGAVEIVSTMRSAHLQQKQALDERVREAHARVTDPKPTLLTLPASQVPNGRQVLSLTDAQLPWVGARLTLHLAGPFRLAVRGPNGCGKSTLLQLLAGKVQVVEGDCRVPVPAAYIDQTLSLLDEERSIVEQLNLLDTPLAEGELRTRLALLQLDARHVTQPVRQLSGGERLKAAMAIALWRETPAQLLLLDEPTNHLDLESVLAFEQALAGFTGAMVAVSHDAAFLTALKPTHTLTWQPAGWQLEPV